MDFSWNFHGFGDHMGYQDHTLQNKWGIKITRYKIIGRAALLLPTTMAINATKW
jgi:hypothetical protein